MELMPDQVLLRFLFWLQVVNAWLRGFWYRWPKAPQPPAGYSTVSCELNGPREVWAMFSKHGWIPWTFHRTPKYVGRVTARVFITREGIR